MNYEQFMLAQAMYHYECEVDKIKKLTPLYDIAVRLADYWKELTGEEITINKGDMQGITVTVHMGTIMPNGRYPSKYKELVYLRELADELLEKSFKFEDFNVSHDSWSSDMVWGSYGYTFRIYAQHGGNCKYTKVGTKTVEEPIYEVECA